jgi:hypothetical protein
MRAPPSLIEASKARESAAIAPCASVQNAMAQEDPGGNTHRHSPDSALRSYAVLIPART